MSVYLTARAGEVSKTTLTPDVALPLSAAYPIVANRTASIGAVAGPAYTAGNITTAESGSALAAVAHTAGAPVRLTRPVVVTLADGSNYYVPIGSVMPRATAVYLGLIS